MAARVNFTGYPSTEAYSTPLHYHIAFTETFEVVEGTLDFYRDRQRRHILLQRGEKVTAQIGQLHTFANDRDTATVMTVETKPAGGVVRAFQLAYGVPGIPRRLQITVFAVAKLITKITGIEKGFARFY